MELPKGAKISYSGLLQHKADGTTEIQKITQAGLVARSPEGTAAKGGMNIRGNEDLWVEIQANTFRNWVNEHLRDMNMQVSDFSTDFTDGTLLCALIEKFSGKFSWNHHPVNHHHYLENAAKALKVVENDGIKLVNIGNEDIVKGNLKLILGLIWSLIVRYQIGRSKFPPRKLMLAWLQAALPECKVSNLTTDWNSGVLLSALLNYCDPDILPHWKSLDPNQSIKNCDVAMDLAHRFYNIPKILEPEYLASPWLDELSGMTYLSYFMKPQGPGYNATMHWVNSQIKHQVGNFSTDWNDGKVFCEILKGLGGDVPVPEKMSRDPVMWERNMQTVIDAGHAFGIKPVFPAKDMTHPEVEHLAIMTYATHLKFAKKRSFEDILAIHLKSTSGRVDEPIDFWVEVLSKEVDLRHLKVYVVAPHDKGVATLVQIDHDGHGSFIPEIYGMHEVFAELDEFRRVKRHFRVLPRFMTVAPPGMAPCAIGSLVEVLVNASGTPNPDDILVKAFSPSGRSHKCPLKKVDQGHSAIFKPDEAGIWEISVTYQGNHIQGGPFTCSVFDQSGVTVHGLEGANAFKAHAFEIDARGVGVSGELHVDIVCEKKSVVCAVEKMAENKFQVTFMPRQNGKHRVYVYFNGYDVKGSPFILRVGSTGRSGKTKSSPSHDKSNHDSYYNMRQHSESPARDRVSPVLYQSSPNFNKSSSMTSSTNHMVKNQTDIKRTRDLYSPKIVEEVQHEYSTYSRTDGGRERDNHRDIESPIFSSSFHDNQSYAKKDDLKSSFLHSKDDSYNRFSSKLTNNARTSESRTLSPINVRQTDYSALSNDSYENHSSKLISDLTTKTTTTNSFFRTNFLGKSDDVGSATRVSPFTLRASQSPTRIIKNDVDSFNSTRENISHSNIEFKKFALSDNHSSSSFLPIGSKLEGAHAIKVNNKVDGYIGQPFEFEIDASSAGSGNLELLVNGGKVTSSVRALDTSQRFIASFTPHEAGVHTVHITFNSIPLPESPFRVIVHDSNMKGSPGLQTLGESVRLVSVNEPCIFEILPPMGSTVQRPDCIILTPSKVKMHAKIDAIDGSDRWRIEFIPREVGTHLIEATSDGTKITGGPLIAKTYDSSLIQVTDLNGGIVGQPCQFKVDASMAGEGQLEISINEGEVPNHVQVVGGGRCLVSFTPEESKSHLIDIKFNGEPVPGVPFEINIGDTSRVSLNLSNLELIPVNIPSTFLITVSGGEAAELQVSVRSPNGELPVRVHGDVHLGFTAEFTPLIVGTHTINVDYNGMPIKGTPFVSKSYDANKVSVGSVTKGSIGHPVQFTVDASDAGEGNLEITISARGHNIPTQVHPKGNAKFAVSFVPVEACDHVINVSFNKMPVKGCPIHVSISGHLSGPQVSGLSGPRAIGVPNSLIINHANGRLDEIEVNVEGPGSSYSIPTQVLQTSDGVFKAEFIPRAVGEHKVHVTVRGVATSGSPYSAKVYDVNAIKVKNVTNGSVGRPVTFLVETLAAGPGNLEVTVNDGRVPTSAQAQGQHTYAISFTPRDAQNHTVELRFNGQDVPGSPFICKISAASRILGIEALDKVSVGEEYSFFVESNSEPVAEILGPARKMVPVIIEEVLSKNGYNVKFQPVDVGDHSVEVRLLAKGGHVEGSPFLLKAYSAEKVLVSDIKTGLVGKSVSFNINASQAGAGNLEIIVACGGKNVPNFVTSEGNARFKVNFKPTEANKHSLSVRFNGHPVPGSPFDCNIEATPMSTKAVSVFGEALRQALINTECFFELEGLDSKTKPQVYITSPTGESLPSKLIYRGEVWLITFQPITVGRHLISVSSGEQQIPGSPFSCNVFDVSRVVISGLNQESPVAVGIPVTFSVDAAGAGEGTLELVISTLSNNTVKAEVTASARGLYEVTFIPQTAEPHFVNITFNDISINGNPFKCDILQSTQNIQAGNPVVVDLIGDDSVLEVLGCNQSVVPYTMIGKRRADFKASEIGAYTIRFIDRETRKVVSSRTVNVFNASMVKIVEVGVAHCHKPATIAVSLADAGVGTLSAFVKCGVHEVSHSIRQSKIKDVVEIVYHPTRIAPHKVILSFNGVPISLKPIEIVVLPFTSPKEIYAHGLGLYQARVGKNGTFAIETNGRPAREFDVVITGPGGQALPVRCYQTKNGHLQAEFSVQKPGTCKIDVLHAGGRITGSPFTCESFDSNKVEVVLPQKSNHSINLPITVLLDTKDAGNADVDISVLSPNGQSVPVTIVNKNEPTTYEASFVPVVSGHYKCVIFYGGEEVKGPITFAVLSKTSKLDSQAKGSGLKTAQRGKESFFTVYCSSPPSIQIERCDGKGERIEPKIKMVGSNEWKIIYTIMSVGLYEIRASSNGVPLADSPWNLTCVDSEKVVPTSGWGSFLDAEGRLILPANILFEAIDAGPGDLRCIVDGTEVYVEHISEENYKRVNITADKLTPGEHDFEVLWSGKTIERCPLKAFVTSQQTADKVSVTGRGLTVAQLGEPSYFRIDASQVTVGGKPEAVIVYLDGYSLPISIVQSKDQDHIWLATYTLTKKSEDSLMLTVKYGGRPIKGSPFTLSIGSNIDASKVKCSGEGLKVGIIGQQIKSWIDTRLAGPGELTAHCTGPKKVAYCELYDHGDATFTLNIKPQEAGRHLLTVKYGGQHVQGSPFALRVVGAPDASKVKVYGPGIEHGVLATFQSRFICDTRGAGAGQLTVRVRGPKGAFRVEMQRESQKDRTILCKFDPTEVGNYKVEVKWAGAHVKNSPFTVLIFDTEEELRRYLSMN